MDRLIFWVMAGAAGFYAYRRGWLNNLMPIASAQARPLINAGFPQFSVGSRAGGSSGYIPPAGAAPYLAHIRAVEKANGIPANLLVRMLDQESKYRPDIISGATRSRVGALGIAQVMQATARDPGYGVPPLADPREPFSAITWAGQYVAALKRSLGTWDRALAAYNFGPGAVRSGKAWPLETRLYVAQITGDVQAV